MVVDAPPKPPVVAIAKPTYYPKRTPPFMFVWGDVTGKTKGWRIVLYAAQTCRKGKPYIFKTGPLKRGRWQAEIKYKSLPRRKGLICADVIRKNFARATYYRKFHLK